MRNAYSVNERFVTQYALRIILLVIGLTLAGCDSNDAIESAAVAPAALDPNTLFYDGFSPGQTGGWHLERDDMGQTAVFDDQLVISINAPNTLQYSSLANELFDDFELTVDLRQLQGAPSSSFGVLFRMVSPEQFYRFEITGDGFYMIERRDNNGQWTRFVPDWTATPAINQGLNAMNQLTITAVGPSMRFAVNGAFLQEINDATYSLGNIGLDAGTFGQTGLQVAFDNVHVSRVN
ncbi:MAG: hypothetical protein AAF614_04890 [Chloroflexota bacterium]